jgi:hypothetical protein
VVAIAPRPVVLVNVRCPLGTLMQTTKARRYYEHTQGALRIGLRREDEPISQAYPELR